MIGTKTAISMEMGLPQSHGATERIRKDRRPGEGIPEGRIRQIAALGILLLLTPFIGVWGGEPGVYEGRVVPKDFVPLCAPQNSLRLPFWGSDSTGIKLQEIEPEGKQVASGDVIARFFFPSESAREHLDQQQSKNKAKREETLIGLQKTISELASKLERAKVEEGLSRLDLGRKSTLAVIRQRIMEADVRIQEVERRAMEHKLAAARDNLERTRTVLDSTIRLWDSYFEIFNRGKDRYSVRAPASGFLFYPLVEKQKRKVQKGDDLNSGVHFLSVVTSKRVEVMFYLPEGEFSKVAESDTVSVFVDGREIPARVTKIGFFPQRLGDVTLNFHRPDAWEKCFVVRADLLEPLQLGSKDMIRVKPRKP